LEPKYTRKREVRTLRDHRPSSEDISNVEYAALTILFQGQVFPTGPGAKGLLP